MADVRQVLADAQAAEARGDKSQAISLLKRAAELYRDGQNHNRALKMLRHIRRLEGLDELEVLEGGNEPDEVPPRRKRVIEERGPSLAPPELEAWCSFCCRPRAEVGALVAGPTGSYICAGCVGAAQGFLGAGAPVVTRQKVEPLAHQAPALARLRRPDSTLGLLMGPVGAGRSTLLAALADVATCVDLDGALSALPDAPRVVIAVRCSPPAAPLTIGGQPVYDTATLVAACGEWVPEPVLARVDTVAVLPAFDAPMLAALAAKLGVTEGADALVQLALKASRPAAELQALIARLK